MRLRWVDVVELLAFRVEDQELTGLRYGSCRVDEKFLSVACIYASLIECCSGVVGHKSWRRGLTIAKTLVKNLEGVVVSEA